MKRFLLFYYCLFFSVFSIFSQSYKSNILMQFLPEQSDTEYELVVNDNEYNLFCNGSLVKRKTIIFSDDFDYSDQKIIIENYDNNSIESYTYKNNLLVHYECNDYSVSNSYDGDLLIFSTFNYADSDQEVVLYIRDVQSGNLIGTKRMNSYNWNGDYYLVDNDLLLTEISNGTYLENTFTLDESGNILYSKNNIDYVYSSDGLLIEEKTQDSSTKYFYNDNKQLISSESVSNNQRIIYSYDNGKLINFVTYNNDAMVESTVYNVNGNIKTLYSNEKALAEVYYDKNNMKVVDIRYFN